MSRSRLTPVALVLLVLLATAACGQKPNVAQQIEGPQALGGGLPAGSTVDEEGNILNAEGEVIGNVEEGITDPDALAGGTGGLTGGSTTGGSTGGTTGGSTGGSTTDGSTGGTTSPGNTQGSSGGISGDKIVIGIHAPLTGAAPVPSDSVDKGKDLYFRWMHEVQKQKVNGYTVEAVLKNDQYNPSTAVAVCKEMVEKDGVFLLSGAAGADQIQACARYSESVGVPYISAGVTESLVNTFRTYFATSMTYPAQGPLLVDYMSTKLGAKGEKNGMVFFNSSTFQDGWSSFQSAADKAGLPIDYEKQVSKNAGTSEARQVIQDLQLAQIENVFVLTSPVFFINMLKQAGTQGYRPQWVGVGISMTFDTVAAVGCADAGSAIDKAKFFAPFPAWIDSNRFDPDFRKASAQLTNKGEGDDFMWLSWIAGKGLWEMFEASPKPISREGFIQTVEKMRNLKTGIGPVLNFSPTDHFGADEVHVSEARCSDRRWHTIETFASDF